MLIQREIWKKNSFNRYFKDLSMHIQYIIVNFLFKQNFVKFGTSRIFDIFWKHKKKIQLPVGFFAVEDRQRGRFAGFSIYVSTTGDIEGSILCYKDGPKLPPLNFSTTCTEYGRYIIFYNERKEGVAYPDGYELSLGFTELCEVIVKGKYVLYLVSDVLFLTAVIT